MGAATGGQPEISTEAIRSAMVQAVEQALEIMCFAEALPADDLRPWEAGLIAARVDVGGDRRGVFRLGISRSGARQIADSFLARDVAEGDDVEVQRVVCELANIVCGSMLTRLDPGAAFTLQAPTPAAESGRGDRQVEVEFAVEDGGRLWCSFEPERAGG